MTTDKVKELKKEYEEFCKSKSTSGYSYGWHVSNLWDFLEQKAIEPDKEVSAEEVWKGVSNPPKENGFYLVYDENIYGHEEKLRVEIYRYSTYNDSWYWGGNCYHPTYWRELPPLPNKENVSASLVRELKLGGENLAASLCHTIQLPIILINKNEAHWTI
jgi:hypothetical protein